MNSDRVLNPQPVSMIPVCLHISTGLREASQESLASFIEAQDKPYVLTDDIIERSINLYTEQNEDILDLLKQCDLWREEALTHEQKRAVDQIEKDYRCLGEINEEILGIIDLIQDQTIDRVLEKDDFSLAIDFLMGKSKI